MQRMQATHGKADPNGGDQPERPNLLNTNTPWRNTIEPHRTSVLGTLEMISKDL